MKSRPWVIALALALPALGGCGGAEALDPGAAQSLQQQVRELATVTQEGNLELAVDRAEALKTEVQQAQDSGAVTPGRAGRIQENIDAFIASIQPAQTPAPVAPTTPPAPTSAAPAPTDTIQSTTPTRRRGLEDSGTPAERQQDMAEEAAEEAQKYAEKEEKERQKREEENREGGDD